jgi:hypothetical protein
MRAEQELHHANIDACAGDAICEALEKARNSVAKERIMAGRKECFDECHYQSGGKGGR